MTSEGDQYKAMRATITQSGGISSATIENFLQKQTSLRNRDIRVALEEADVQAGVSAAHVFFRLDDLGDAAAQHCGHYVVRFDVGVKRLFQQTSLRNQFDVMRALYVQNLEVPEAVWFDEEGVIAPGTAALVMKRVEACAPNTLLMPQMLYMEKGPFVEAPPEKREAMIKSVMLFCRRLHALPLAQIRLPFAARRGGDGHFIDREINWMQAELHSRFPQNEEAGERRTLLSRIRRSCDAAAEWLRQRAPRDREPVLVHGDMTLANVIFNEGGSVRAVLDWELCHEGLPEEDITWLPLAARSSAYFYNANIVAVPTLSEMVSAYQVAGGEAQDLAFATVLSAFRILSISALAIRSMPREFWPQQDALWGRQEAMLTEAQVTFGRL